MYFVVHPNNNLKDREIGMYKEADLSLTNNLIVLVS